MSDAHLQVHTLLATARELLGGGRVAALEAETLLGHLLGADRSWLFAHPEKPLTEPQQQAFGELLQRRLAGEPIAYLVGQREFWSMTLVVTPNVLIPRPETERLVEVALDFIPSGTAWRVADLGTGSGAVALAIALERPACEVHATDISPAALAVAARNVESIVPGRVQLHRGCWLEPLQDRFHAIVSNPPYVAEGDEHLRQGDCRFEPREALTPGMDGMTAIRKIARDALPFLESGGLLAFEHGFDQGPACRRLLAESGYEKIATVEDLEGRDRVTRGTKPL